jgi:hypothetical protein
VRGLDEQTQDMFSYLSPEARVRQDDPLRPLRRMTDDVFKRLWPRFARLYLDMGQRRFHRAVAAGVAAAVALHHSQRAPSDGGDQLQHSVSLVQWAEPR